MANDLTFNQLSTVLNSIVQQATGQSAAAITDTSSFVSVANTVLKQGYDPLNTAISQVIARTIFSVRPYSRKFKSLEVTNQQYGNHTRKLTMIDKPLEDSSVFSLVDGQSIDMYKVNKPSTLQTNFYGANTWSKSTTVYKNQLDNAFKSPDEFASFISMQMQNVSDILEQAHETTARMTIANLIGGTVKANASGTVVHLITEYNDETGSTIDETTWKAPENYENFIKWAYAKIRTVGDYMTERTSLFHQNIADKTIMRHTPIDKQNLWIMSANANEIDARVFSTVFGPDYLKQTRAERVNFWQSPVTPDSINVKASWLGTDGTVQSDSTGSNTRGIFAVLADKEAAGYTRINQSVNVTPFNARGEYTNYWWNFTDRYWNDNTENAVVFLLD